jgi:hypothetical protein
MSCHGEEITEKAYSRALVVELSGMSSELLRGKRCKFLYVIAGPAGARATPSACLSQQNG